MRNTSSTVKIRHREFASEVTSTGPTVTALIKRVVPSTGRGWVPTSRSWLVYGTRVAGLLAAFAAAGISVEVVDEVARYG